MALQHRDADIATFKTAVGSYASGVAVITVRNPEGRPSGMTATAFASVSMDPLLVCICVHREARTCHEILHGGFFGVNLLSASMEEHSGYCARAGADKTLPAEWLVEAGPKWSAPALHGSIAFLDCEAYRHFPAGTHEVVIGRVCGIGLDPDAEPPVPLIHFRSQYRRLADLALSGS